MENLDGVTLHIENFRAIKKAKIDINGITVVSGINGCGKSTLSKLLYSVFKLANNLEQPAEEELYPSLLKIDDAIRHLFQSTRFDIRKRLKLQEKFRNSVSKHNKDAIHNYLEELKNELESANNVIDKDITRRLLKIFSDLFREDKNITSYLKNYESPPKNISLTFFISLLKIYSDSILTKYRDNIEQRPRRYLFQEVRKIFHTNDYPTLLEVREFGVPIIGKGLRMESPSYILNTIYIDTPMFFENVGYAHWEDANSKLLDNTSLYKNNEQKIDSAIDNLIIREVFNNHASIQYDDEKGYFVFKSSHGYEIDLSDCATGIKSFSIINMLIKNKSINEKTLLILDEPEAHLHPQWVIEFGKLLTLVHKHIGAKIFVVTHSPEMVQALKYIPKKEGITPEHINFYLAEIEKDGCLFNYKNLNGDISEIFDSFNTSYIKLEEYGED